MKSFLVHNLSVSKQFSARIFVCLASIHGFRFFSTDVTQSYLQSDEKLKRDIYGKLPKELTLDQDLLLKLLLPLYGISESGDYWCRTFILHLEKDLKMSSSFSDPALYFKRGRNCLHGARTMRYLCRQYITCWNWKISKRTGQLFKFNLREWDETQFSGLKIEKHGNEFLAHQREYIRKLEPLPNQGDIIDSDLLEKN